MRIKLNNSRIVIDDVVEDEDGKLWSQCCESCKQALEKDNANIRFDDAGSGICGVEGCNEQSSYYIDLLDDFYIKIRE